MTKKIIPVFKFTDGEHADVQWYTTQEYKDLKQNNKREAKSAEDLKLKELKNKLWSKKYTTSTITNLVHTEEVNSIDDLKESILDQICSLEETIKESDIKEEFGFTERAANAYINKLKKFLVDELV